MPRPDASGARLLVVVAHADDETVGAGVLLSRAADAWVLHLTDGAPRDHRFIARGFDGTREEYAAARRRELESALALAGIGRDRLLEIDGIADQEAAEHLPRLADEIALIFQTVGPNVVLTLAYEGGHPDHDAAAWAVRAAADRLFHPPDLYEMPLYHAGAEGMVVQEFLPEPPAPEAVVHRLTADEIALKERMLGCFATQAATLAAFRPPVRELFRPMAGYDFTRPPHPGRLQYEIWGMRPRPFWR